MTRPASARVLARAMPARKQDTIVFTVFFCTSRGLAGATTTAAETMKRVLEGTTRRTSSRSRPRTTQTGVWDQRGCRTASRAVEEYQMRNGNYTSGLKATTSSSRRPTASTRWPGTSATSPHPVWASARPPRSAPTPCTANIDDHFSVVYRVPDGRPAATTKAGTGPTPTSRSRDYVLGSKRILQVFGARISGESAWRYRGGKKTSVSDRA